MGKRFKTRYSPGELEKVRKRLGKISPEEAKKMSNILGGEIGVEKEDDQLKQKYKTIKDRSYREKIIKNKRSKPNSLNNTEESSSDEMTSYLYSNNLKKKKAIGFFDRVKLNFLCSRPDYQIKEFSGAVISIFSFFLQIRDTLNPRFLKESHQIFYTSLSSFVIAVRKLFSKKNQSIYKEIQKNGYYAKILTTIKEWDINGIELELRSLKRFKYKQQISNLKKITRMIYKPLMLFHEIDEQKDIMEAINHAFNINMQFTEDKGSNISLIDKYYFEAKTNLNTVFFDIKRIFYPILLKFTSYKFYEYHDFFRNEFYNILDFLKITKDDILSSNKTYAPEMANFHNIPSKEKIIKPKKKDKINPVLIQAKNLIIKLFPKAGFDNLAKMPDLFPYFKALFHFPPGYELIPADDPFQQVIILVYIINDLLYGFRHIQFGIARNENLENIVLQKKIDNLLTNWTIITTEVITKEYVNNLVNYCVHIEKDISFVKSNTAKKIKSELNQLKKNYFLPYLDISLFGTSPNIIYNKELPKLQQITQEFIQILSQIVNELNQVTHQHKQAITSGQKSSLKNKKCTSIENPWEKIIFDIDNSITKRLSNLLVTKIPMAHNKSKIIDKRTNSQLIFYVHSLISLLDSWLNNPNSHLYNSHPKAIYRNTGILPKYKINNIDPFKYFEEETKKEHSIKLNYQSDYKKTNFEQLEKYIKAVLSKTTNSKSYIQLIAISSQDLSNLNKIENQVKVFFNNQNEKIYSIDNSLIILSPDNEIKKIFQLFKKFMKPFITDSITIGIITFFKNANLIYTWKVFNKIQELAREQTRTKIIYFDYKEKKIKTLKIKN